MAKFLSFDELPKFLDLNHYSAASELTSPEWYRVLTQRFYLFTLLETGRDVEERYPDLASAYSAAFARDIQNMRGMAVEKTDIPHFFGPRGYAQFLENATCSVRPLTLADFYSHAICTPGYLAELEEWLTDPIGKFVIGTDMDVMGPLLLNGPSGTSDGHIGIHADLNQPDNVLIHDFTVQLPKIRAATNHYPRKSTCSPKFESWARYGLLPYLDLKIWEMETGAKISQDVMALAITPHREGNSFRTTIVTAEKLKKNRCQDVLQLAIAEHAAKSAPHRDR